MTPAEQPVLILTPLQVQQGYVIMVAGLGYIQRHEYEVIRKLDDGNFLVKDPAGAKT